MDSKDGLGPKLLVGVVEVQKDADSRMWYNASILDIVGKERLMVSFEDDVWQKQEFPFSHVRKLPKYSQAELDKFTPRVGDEVELRVNATEHHPAGWAIAVVKNIKHSFFFVTRSGSSRDSNAEAIVEKSMLRPIVKGSSLGSQKESLKQETFKFAPGLQEWITTEDAIGCFARVEADSGLMFIKIGKNDLRLFGDDKSVMLAKKLLDVHQKHQQTIQMHMEKRERRLTALEKRRNQIEGTGYQHSIEITIDSSFVRRVIGTKGEAIRAVMQKYDVNIHVQDPDSKNPDEPRIVRIFGNSLDSIDKARGEVEFIEEVYPETIERPMYGWITGQGGRNINKLKELAGLMFARLERDSGQLVLGGTRNAVEDAMALFEAHIMYHPIFSQMDDEMEELIKELEEYGDYSARREWNWFREEEEEYADWRSGSKGGKDKGKGKKGGSGKDAWNDDKESKGKGNRWNDWNDDKESKGKGSRWNDDKEPKGKGSKAAKRRDWYDWEEEEEKPPSRPSKGSGKGNGGKSKNSWRDEAWEEEEEKPPARSKGSSKGNSSKSKGAKREEESEDEEKPPARASKGGSKGTSSKSKGGKREEEEEEEKPSKGSSKGSKSKGAKREEEEEEEEEKPPVRASKGGSKASSSKASGRGTWREVRHEDKDERKEESDKEDSAPARGRGRGRHQRATSADDAPSSPAAPKPAVNRRMGKKGLRQ